MDDVVEGVVRSLDYLESRPDAFEIVNLGNSETVEQTWADVSKAGELLGWEPRVGIEEDIERFVAWFREHEELLVD